MIGFLVFNTSKKAIQGLGKDARKGQPGNSTADFTGTLNSNAAQETCKLQGRLLRPVNAQPVIQLAIKARANNTRYNPGETKIVN